MFFTDPRPHVDQRARVLEAEAAAERLRPHLASRARAAETLRRLADRLDRPRPAPPLPAGPARGC